MVPHPRDCEGGERMIPVLWVQRRRATKNHALALVARTGCETARVVILRDSYHPCESPTIGWVPCASGSAARTVQAANTPAQTKTTAPTA